MPLPHFVRYSDLQPSLRLAFAITDIYSTYMKLDESWFLPASDHTFWKTTDSYHYVCPAHLQCFLQRGKGLLGTTVLQRAEAP